MNDLIKTNIIHIWILIFIFTLGCQNNDFNSMNLNTKKNPSTNTSSSKTSEDATLQPPEPVTTIKDPSGVITEKDDVLTTPDYTSCLNSNNGIIGFPNQCPPNTVNIIINDGAQKYAKQMTCCPINPQILSSNPNELNIIKSDKCSQDEVQTGIASTTNPISVYCSKINTDKYMITHQLTSIRVKKDTPIDQYITNDIYNLVKNGYNLKDACACPDGYLMAGGHTWKDNKCEDKCVKIQKK